MHDLGAELQGYKDELAVVDGDRAKAVRGEIDRVSKAIEERAAELENGASEHEEAGQDVPAAEARVEARRYRAMLDDGQEDTAESKPTEKAVPARGQGRKRG
ncbi:hypothetical protein [Actinoallomurus sp. CA-142502]|uniref:hypothetical protein n=1 Tax=Actinoallomurus sp. CA-142502 TaxID=3239885 RepID=UPI003D8E6CC4